MRTLALALHRLASLSALAFSAATAVDYYGSSRTVDIHVRRLRMKLGNAVNHLETVRGVGYSAEAP